MADTIKPVGGVQVLPPNTQKSPGGLQIKQYKADSNLKRDIKHSIVTIQNKCECTIGPNQSMLCVIDFRHKYTILPFLEVLEVAIDDDEFFFEYMVKSITTENLTIKLNNTWTKARNITIYFKLTQQN